MGSSLSSIPAPTPASEPQTSHNSRTPRIVFPTEVDGTSDCYDDFWEEVYCAHHQDGKHIIICWPKSNMYVPSRDDEMEEGWAIKRLRSNYELLSRDHPRVVRYNGALVDGSLVVEKLFPGPLSRLILPKMDLTEPHTKRSKTMLSLYYRWALQALSALGYFHSQRMYLRTFAAEMIWLRADYSLAVTGFINAVKDQGTVTVVKNGKEIQLPRWDVVDPDTGLQFPPKDYHHPNEWLEYDKNQDRLGYPQPCVKADLFHWATFTWRLMLNDCTEEPEILQSEHPTTSSLGKSELLRNCIESPYSISSDPTDPRLYQNLDEIRLGSVIAKAWNGQYENADDIAKQVRASASEFGIAVVEDEIEIAGGWENVFETIDMGDGWRRTMRFKSE